VSVDQTVRELVERSQILRSLGQEEEANKLLERLDYYGREIASDFLASWVLTERYHYKELIEKIEALPSFALAQTALSKFAKFERSLQEIEQGVHWLLAEKSQDCTGRRLDDLQQSVSLLNAWVQELRSEFESIQAGVSE
jgi:hypothetical protein